MAANNVVQKLSGFEDLLFRLNCQLHLTRKWQIENSNVVKFNKCIEKLKEWTFSLNLYTCNAFYRCFKGSNESREKYSLISICWTINIELFLKTILNTNIWSKFETFIEFTLSLTVHNLLYSFHVVSGKHVNRIYYAESLI